MINKIYTKTFRNLLFFSLTLITSSYAQYNTWVNPTPVSNRLKSIIFVDSLYGWAIGENSSIVKTIDGGESWTLQVAPKFASLDRVCFFDRQNGFIVGGDGGTGNGALLKTSDGGETWIDINPRPEDGYSFHDLSFI